MSSLRGIKLHVDVNVTVIDADSGREVELSPVVFREYPGGLDAVSVPTDVLPKWVGVGSEVIVAEDGSVVETFEVKDMGGVDLTAQSVKSLPSWGCEVTHLYSRV